MQTRQLLLGAIDAALQAVNGRRCVHGFLQQHPINGSVCVIAIGKAAAAMAQGAMDVLGEQIHSGLVVTKRGQVDAEPEPALTLRHLQAGHPFPDEASLEAGEALLTLLDRAPTDATLLFLISGGTSSLVEILPHGLNLTDLNRVNQWLLACGWDIHGINWLRKRLSCIKGGRLARYLNGRRTFNLMISDVPGNDPRIIGSGLLSADQTDAAPPETLPDWVVELLGRVSPEPVPDESCFSNIQTHLVATPQQAQQAALAYARSQGQRAHGHESLLTGEIHDVAKHIAGVLRHGQAEMHVWCGEPTVQLPDYPGRGGRNQSLALAVALEIAGDDNIVFASVGTDGNDGATDDAGAMVDCTTSVQGNHEGLNARAALKHADAGPFLEAAGALVSTGSTGTNVMDLMLGWRG